MAERWANMRLPADLHARLKRLAKQEEESHAAGRSSLPNEYAEHCPLHHVIKLGLDALEGHRTRARQPRKAKGQEATTPETTRPG